MQQARACAVELEKRSETLKANESPPARNESLYLYMALHEPVLFFLKREGKKKAGFNLLIKKGNKLYGADEGALFREKCLRVLGHRSGCCCYVHLNRNLPQKSMSLDSQNTANNNISQNITHFTNTPLKTSDFGMLLCFSETPLCFDPQGHHT